MTSTQRFAVWLKGFLDACDNKPTEKQVAKIKDVLNSIFEHVAEPVSEKSEKCPPLQAGKSWTNPKNGYTVTARC